MVAPLHLESLHRGKGLGMALPAHDIELTDVEGIPAFLESGNPAGNARYERLGFRQVGAFTTPDGARTVATMWRDVATQPRPD
jgi:predicted N-acetyltransferase YhbS